MNAKCIFSESAYKLFRFESIVPAPPAPCWLLWTRAGTAGTLHDTDARRWGQGEMHYLGRNCRTSPRRPQPTTSSLLHTFNMIYLHFMK